MIYYFPATFYVNVNIFNKFAMRKLRNSYTVNNIHKKNILHSEI
jgi:hypothetical protein